MNRVTLGSIAKLQSGFAFKSRDWVSKGVPVVKIASVKDGWLDFSNASYISESVAVSVPKAILRSGDILVGMTGYVGSVARVKQGDLPCLLNQRVGRVEVTHPELADSEFLFHALRSFDAKRQMEELAHGSAQANLSPTGFGRITIPLPPLDEQRRIAGVLGALDDLADENLRQVGRIRALSQTLYASFAARSSTKVKLGAVAQTNPDKVKPQTEGNISYVDIASLSDGNMVSQVTTWDQAPSRARRGAVVGDTLWSTVRPNRRGHAVLTKHIASLVVSTGIAVLRPHLVGPAELFAATDRQGFVDYLVSRAEGSAYPAVSASAFADVEIADLASADREMFESAMWPLWRWVGELEYESHHLRQTRDELLPLLLSGRVRVGEVAA